MQQHDSGWTQAFGVLGGAKAAVFDFTDTYRWWCALAAFALLLIGLGAIGSTLFVDSIEHRNTLVVAQPGFRSITWTANEAPQVLAQRPAILEPFEEMAAASEPPTSAELSQPAPTTETKTVELERGDTLMEVLVEAGVSRSDAYNAIEAMREKMDPRTIRPGQKLDVTMQIAPEPGDEAPPLADPVMAATFPMLGTDDEADEFTPRLAELMVQPDAERSLHIQRQGSDTFTVEEVITPLHEEFVRAHGRIDSNLFLAADQLGIPPTTIVELIRMYSYDVDFQREIRKGDEFEIFYTRYLSEAGEAVKDGTVYFGALTLSGKRHALYRYTTPDDNVTDYYDESGHSAKKFLMKTPVDGARLSSGFGKRKHPILGYTKMHQGVDFAAPRGTPVVAAGNGVIERANRNGGYGNYIRIRHANGYSTAYGHLNGFAKGITAGTRVAQGQIIGYVGTTGQSTGPHLHYEILVKGKQVNPMNVRVPTGRVLEGEVLQAYLQQRNELDTRMAAIPAITSVTTAQAQID